VQFAAIDIRRKPILNILRFGLDRSQEPTQKWLGKRKGTKLIGWLLLASNLAPEKIAHRMSTANLLRLSAVAAHYMELILM
jgi:hypothetical protein